MKAAVRVLLVAVVLAVAAPSIPVASAASAGSVPFKYGPVMDNLRSQICQGIARGGNKDITGQATIKGGKLVWSDLARDLRAASHLHVGGFKCNHAKTASTAYRFNYQPQLRSWAQKICTYRQLASQYARTDVHKSSYYGGLAGGIGISYGLVARALPKHLHVPAGPDCRSVVQAAVPAAVAKSHHRPPALPSVVFVPGLSIARVRLGMTEAQVRKLLGKPTQKIARNSPMPGMDAEFWDYYSTPSAYDRGAILLMEVTFLSGIGNTVYDIRTENPKAHTPNGVTIGSTVGTLRHFYPGVLCSGEDLVCAFGQSSAENHFHLLAKRPIPHVTTRTKIDGFQLVNNTAVGP